MYYPDMHRETRWPGTAPREYTFIGWLDAAFPFPIGDVDAMTVRKIRELCKHPEVSTRGFHACTLCRKEVGIEDDGIAIQDEIGRLGSAEILVRASDGSDFLFPDLILHYIEDHHYLPPAAFRDAVTIAVVPKRAP